MVISYSVCSWKENERVHIQTNLLGNRKLGLVFDLDNTLMEVQVFSILQVANG